MIGRNELHVSWNAPEVPLGRFNRYDLLMDDKIVYSGVDLNLTLRRLTPDTEYSFVVSVFDFDKFRVSAFLMNSSSQDLKLTDANSEFAT